MSILKEKYSTIGNLINIQTTVWSSDLYTLLMRYGVKFTSYRIKIVYKSLDQTVYCRFDVEDFHFKFDVDDFFLNFRLEFEAEDL